MVLTLSSLPSGSLVSTRDAWLQGIVQRYFKLENMLMISAAPGDLGSVIVISEMTAGMAGCMPGSQMLSQFPATANAH